MGLPSWAWPTPAKNGELGINVRVEFVALVQEAWV